MGSKLENVATELANEVKLESGIESPELSVVTKIKFKVHNLLKQGRAEEEN